jgi:GH18 family chitinase
MKIRLLLFWMFLAYIPLKSQQPCREVVGYYPSWQWYDRNKLVKPQSIDYSQYTIIQYAFFNVTSTGHLLPTDPWADKNLLLGDINWAVAPAGYESAYDFGNPAFHHPNTSFAHYAHQGGVKLLISLGGWTLSHHFPGIAADPAKRQIFAQQCALICELYDLDGVDIDWEYPGYAPHSGTPADKANFTLLLQDVRDELNAMEVILGRELMLTAAVGAAPSHQENYEWDSIIPLLDIINVMSYDYYGTWDNHLNHHAPLYHNGPGSPEFTCDATIQRLLNMYNVPAEKITMGLAFYGRSHLSSTTPVLFGPGTGQPDWFHFGIDEGTPLYYHILLQMGVFAQHWDATAQVPYLTSMSNNSFVSFDNEESLTAKAQYIVNNDLRGCIIWEITGDYIETSPGSGQIAGTPLISAVNEVFCSEAQGCVGDFDADGYITFSDLTFLLTQYGCQSNCSADLNGSGHVDFGDLAILLSLYGNQCP